MARDDARSDHPLVEALTPRELEIVSHLAERRTNREIADRLVLSVNTIKWYNRQIYDKLGVDNRREAVARAAKLGLLPADDAAGVPPHNLPAPLNPLVGRRAILERVAGLLARRARLLTVLGPGGIGKTRLAVAAARAQLKERPGAYPDGLFFVPLATLTDSRLIPAAIAQAVGFQFYQGSESQQQQLVRYLSKRQLLLVLDNLEHLLSDRSVQSLVDILEAAGGVVMLVTSRTRLNAQGEHLVRLDGLAVPTITELDRWADPVHKAEAFGAIQLFVHSVRRLKPGFSLDGRTLKPAVQICMLAGGLPLAIELAAGWAAVLEPAEIAAELERSLDILETDARNVPPRHQSQRAVFDASWTLLSGAERRAMESLTVFEGGFDRQGASEAGDVALSTLTRLVNRSWVGQVAGGRFQMHDLIRRYAREKLARDPARVSEVYDRHSAYYCDWLSRQEEPMWGPGQQEVMLAIEADEGNVRAACLWAAAHRHVRRLNDAARTLGLFYYHWRGNYQTGETLFRQLAETIMAREGWPAAGTTTEQWAAARLLGWRATFCGLMGELETSARLLEKGRALLDGPALAAVNTRVERAHIAWQSGYRRLYSEAEEATQDFAESFELFRQADDAWGMAVAELGLGRATRELDALEEARRALDSSLVRFQAMGNQLGTREALTTLAAIAIRQTRFADAERLIDESLSICCETDHAAVALALGFRAAVRFETGRFQEAEEAMDACLALTDDLGMALYALYWRFTLGRIYLHAGKYDAARALAALIASRARDLEDDRAGVLAAALLGELALAEGDPATALERFQDVCPDVQPYAVAGREAGRLAMIGLAHLGVGRADQAREYLAAALARRDRDPEFVGLLVALAGAARLAMYDGDAERAVELYALASRYPAVANSRWFEDAIGRHIDAAAADLPPAIIEDARARGRTRRLDDPIPVD